MTLSSGATYTHDGTGPCRSGGVARLAHPGMGDQFESGRCDQAARERRPASTVERRLCARRWPGAGGAFIISATNPAGATSAVATSDDGDDAGGDGASATAGARTGTFSTMRKRASLTSLEHYVTNLDISRNRASNIAAFQKRWAQVRPAGLGNVGTFAL